MKLVNNVSQQPYLEGDYLKTILIIIGIALAVLLALMGYACVVVGSDAEHQMEAWERERYAGRD